MATKGAKKKSAKRAPAKRQKKNRKRGFGWFAWLLFTLVAALGCLIAAYYFGSFETRERIEQQVLTWTQPVRVHPATPGPLAAGLDALHDSLPSSRGFTVEGGELGRDPDSPFIAGIPQSRVPVRVIPQKHHARIERGQSGQLLCAAWRLTGTSAEKSAAELSPEAIGLALSEEPWARAMQLFERRYAKRFDEVWIYLGPIFAPESSMGGSAPPRAIAHYAILFDLTEAGGLRALALNIPAQPADNSLAAHITSIAELERATGLQFLPDLNFSLRIALVRHVSPRLW